MPQINAVSFFHCFAESPVEVERATQFMELLSHQGDVMVRMNNEIAMHRKQYEHYCEAMEARNRELDELDKKIEALTERCRKEARHKIYWMAAAVGLVIFVVVRMMV